MQDGTTGSGVRLGRALVLLALVYAAALGTASTAASLVAESTITTTDRPFETALVLSCSVVLALAGGWLAVTCTLVVVDALRARDGGAEGAAEGAVEEVGAASSPRTPAGCPPALARFVLGWCGAAALTTGLAVPATAGGQAEHAGGQGATTARALPLPPLRLPDRVVDAPLPTTGPTGHGQVRDTVTVRAGDTLWCLARRGLPASAPAAEVAAGWRRIYAANRAAIGPDPDLILPGTILRLPGPGQADHQ